MVNRVLWADAAKGLSIVLVVLWHVTDKNIPSVAESLSHSVTLSIWEQVSLFLTPARMPLFFLISGIFTAKAIQRTWRTSWLRPLNNYYVFVIWLFLSIPLASIAGSVAENPIDTLRDAATGLFFGATGPWYIYALALYFIGAKVLKGVNPVATCGVSACAAIVSYAGIFNGPGNFHYVLENAFFFLIGAYFPRLLFRLSDFARPSLIAPALAVVLTVGWVVTVETVPAFPIVRFVAAILGSSALLFAVAAASKFYMPGTQALAWLGKRTLGIYLLHGTFLAIAQNLLAGIEMSFDGLWAELAGLLYVPLIVGFSAGSALFAAEVLRKIGLGFMFDVALLPKRSRRSQKGPNAVP